MDVLQQLQARAEARDGVLTWAEVAAAGAPQSLVRRQLRAGEWEVLLRGTYLTEPWRTGPERRRSWARAAVLTVRRSVVGLGTAAALHGLDGAPRTGLVDLVVDAEVQVGQRPIVVNRFTLDARDVVDLQGIPATSPVRTLADLVPRLRRAEALAVLDSALRTGTVDRAALARAALLAARRPGCCAARDLWGLADPRAESVLESRARLRCIDGDLAPDELQLEVRDEHGHLLARADMAFRRRRRPRSLPLLLEADGRDVHDRPEALHRDRWRTNTLVALGYDVVRCTWRDTLQPGTVPQMVRQAL